MLHVAKAARTTGRGRQSPLLSVPPPDKRTTRGLELSHMVLLKPYKQDLPRAQGHKTNKMNHAQPPEGEREARTFDFASAHLSLRLQVPNNDILTQNSKPKYLIIGYLDPLGLPPLSSWPQAFPARVTNPVSTI